MTHMNTYLYMPYGKGSKLCEIGHQSNYQGTQEQMGNMDWVQLQCVVASLEISHPHACFPGRVFE